MDEQVCMYCERRCRLTTTTFGFCGMYCVENGKVVERFPHRFSSIGTSHIEGIPFYHFQPGSRTLMLGGAGCNFDCHYCSNAYLARSDPKPLLKYEVQPERIVRYAQQNGCHNITFPDNEPTVALPTLLELSGYAAKADLPLGVLSNGYATEAAALEMGKAFDFINVSIKSLQDDFYRQYVGVTAVDVIKRNLEIFRRHTHLEISTPVIQGLNDEEIPQIADFIASLDVNIPWHVFRLLPEYKMTDMERPPIEAVNAALEQARRKLPFVYFSNFVGSRWVSTLCPDCGAEVVERINLGGCGAKVLSYQLNDGHCSVCEAPVPFGSLPVSWHERD